MTDDDDFYAIDAFGNPVLIGLSAEETEEYIRLDATISESFEQAKKSDGQGAAR